ncbi:MAG TPA: hypothetical protein VI434_01015 [Candidatus Dormibacteraeota bacterium]
MLRKVEPITLGCDVRIEGDNIAVTGLSLHDADLASYVSQHPEVDRPAVVERGLKVGLIALRNASVTINVDFVAREFDRLMHRTDESHHRAAIALDAALRETFAAKDGTLPRTLEQFLGKDGTLRRLVDDLFDEERRDSAIGRMRTLLAGYFDGDGAVISRMLDPRLAASPLHGFRAEMREMLKDVSERLVRLEAAREARADERQKGTAKGLDFEDAVEARLDALLRGTGDLVEPTGTAVGNSVRSRKGDFLITLDPSWTRGVPVCVAVEAKSGRVGLSKLCRDLDETRRNRGAAIAVAVYRAGNAPSGCAPFTLHGEHIICELDPDDPDDTAFTAAVRLGRALALSAARDHADVIDATAVRRDLDGIRAQLNAIVGMKSKLTSISAATGDVRNGLDALRQGVLDRVISIEGNVADAGGRSEVA